MNIPIEQLSIGLGWFALIGGGGCVLARMNHRGHKRAANSSPQPGGAKTGRDEPPSFR